MKVKHLLITIAALVVTLGGIIPAGCTSAPDMGGLPTPVTLSAADKDSVLEIANTTDAMQQRLANGSVTAVDHRWLAIKWVDGEFAAFRSIDEDWENDPNYALLTDDYRCYPAVTTTFDAPDNWQVTVAVDLEMNKAVYVTENPVNTGPQPEIEIRLAPIHDAQVNIAESFPPQVFLHIQGGLSDGCTTYHDTVITREGNTINVELTVQRPKNQSCTAVYTYFERNEALGSDFTSGEEYTVTVNDYKTTFVMQ